MECLVRRSWFLKDVGLERFGLLIWCDSDHFYITIICLSWTHTFFSLRSLKCPVYLLLTHDPLMKSSLVLYSLLTWHSGASQSAGTSWFVFATLKTRHTLMQYNGMFYSMMLSTQFDHQSIKENCSKVREAQSIRFAFIVYERPFTIRVLWGDMPLLSDPGFEYCGWAGCDYWLWSHPHSAFLVVLTAHLPVSKFHLTSLGLGPSWFEKKKKSIEDWTDSIG